MKVLITGGAGFVGSHLAERLLELGHKISIIDDLNDFYVPRLKQDNLAAIREKGDYSFYLADIRDAEKIPAIFERERPEIVVHLAARAGVRPSLQLPLLYEEVNLRGTLVLLEAARTNSVRKFVFASSSSIYGISSHVPFREDAHAVMPISPYAATKLGGEHLCYTYSHLYSLSAVCLRLFTVYGPRQRPDLAIRKFTEMIDRGQAITMFGDGSTARDYTFVDDIVNGILGALAHSCSFDVFNLGNSHPVRLSHMISIIERALGKKALVRHLPDQPGDVSITFADISKAARLLNYRPAVSFEEGVQYFVDWYRGGVGVQPAESLDTDVVGP